MGSGDSVPGTGKCRGAVPSRGEVTIEEDFLLEELGRLDAMLGMHWLRKQGSLTIDWKELTMELTMRKKSVTLEKVERASVLKLFLAGNDDEGGLCAVFLSELIQVNRRLRYTQQKREVSHRALTKAWEVGDHGFMIEFSALEATSSGNQSIKNTRARPVGRRCRRRSKCYNRERKKDKNEWKVGEKRKAGDQKEGKRETDEQVAKLTDGKMKKKRSKAVIPITGLVQKWLWVKVVECQWPRGRKKGAMVQRRKWKSGRLMRTWRRKDITACNGSWTMKNIAYVLKFVKDDERKREDGVICDGNGKALLCDAKDEVWTQDGQAEITGIGSYSLKWVLIPRGA